MQDQQRFIDTVGNDQLAKNLAYVLSIPFEFIKKNLSDTEVLSKTFEKYDFDFVYHMAANSDISKGATQTKIDLESTFLTTFNILDQMKKFDVKNIFFPSSSAVYGNSKNKIFEETKKEP